MEAHSKPTFHVEDYSLERLNGVGPSMVQRLNRLQIYNIKDLLFHLPIRYQDRSQIRPLGSLRPGDEVTVCGQIIITDIKFAKKRMLLSRISDGTGFLTLRFFHFNAQQKARLESGAYVQCFGVVKSSAGGLEMHHPEYRFIDNENSPETEEQLTAIYPTTEGLRQASIRNLVDKVLENKELVSDILTELLPKDYLNHEGNVSLKDAVLFVHHPPLNSSVRLLQDGLHPAQRRLAFEELTAHQLSLRQLRVLHQKDAAPQCVCAGNMREEIKKLLPFELTDAQQRVLEETVIDLKKPVPMLRLIQGDVGSGKTIIAALAAAEAVEAGYQVAFMAPTELLAEQHRANLSQWLEPIGLTVRLLSGSCSAKHRKQIIDDVSKGAIHILVGTHALFQQAVEFNKLGLIIIDEQHRFGVHQRHSLREKGLSKARHVRQYPHQLVMTATPIPRTLAQTAYADLDISVIDELPPGRTPVETVVISALRREEVIARVKSACLDNRQAYWVCPLIEESEHLQCQAAQETANYLGSILPELRVGLVHGRLKPVEKDAVMQAFKTGEIDVLVATTVIEVGVDVPNASLMIIENAERLGLSQLHQLRGRVGRGREKSSCVLLYGEKISKAAKSRLGIMRETNDGFIIAQRDLELRGPGELLGVKQTGLMNFRIADLSRDQDLLPAARMCADFMLRTNSSNMDLLLNRWIGPGERYRQV